MPQTQIVYKEIYALCAAQLDVVVAHAARQAATDLYAKISQADDWLRNDYSLSINLIEANQDWLASQVSDALLKVLKRDMMLADKSGDKQGASKLDIDSLSLVSKDEFEDWLNVNKAIKYLERELSQELLKLHQVFRVLNAVEPKADALAIGPNKLLTEFKAALDKLELPTATQGMIYKSVASSLHAELKSLYLEVVSLATKHGIVLESTAPIKPARRPPVNNPREAPMLTEDAVDNAGGVPEGFAYDQELGLTAHSAGAGQLKTLNALSRLNASLTSGKGLQQKSPLANAVAQAQENVANAFGGAQLLNLISTLPPSAYLPEADGASVSLRRVIEQNMLEQVSGPATLAQQESELIDVTDRFFEVVVQKLGVSGNLVKWIEKLKLTILKIVLRDEDFFSDAKHPARLMINKLAQLANSRGGGNKRLQALLDQYIDKVVDEFDTNESAIDEVVVQLDELLERQERAYKRNSERIARSYEDRKKIAEARHLVVRDLRQILAGKAVPVVLLELLDKAGWREHMATTAVREGERSEAYKEVLNVADQLMAWFGKDVAQIDRWALDLEIELEAPSLFEMVQRELEVLAKPDGKVVLKHLEDCLFNDADAKLVNVEQYDWPFDTHEKDIEALQPKGNDSEALTHWHKRILSMKIGDWVEMTDDDGRTRCLRLAWSGRESFRFVFVDSQGMKDEDISLDELVLRFKDNSASFIDNEQVPLVDQGLHQMVQSVYEELSSQASCDVLTGLLNRQAFERALKQSVSSALTNKTTAVLLYFDLDKFNVTNTNYGHLAGDAILRHVADIVRANSPKDGFCGRLGGNEFGMILPSSGKQVALDIAESVRLAVEQAPFMWEEHSILNTVSGGLVEIDLQTDSYDSVMRKAILACDSAKAHGQNRVLVYEAQDADQKKRDEMLSWVQKLDGSLDTLLALRCQEIRPTEASGDRSSHWEILLGVRHEDQVLPPGPLIEAAEHFNRMAKVDRWVVHNVLQWMEDNPLMVERSGGFSINLSGNSLNDDKFLEFVMGELAASNVEPAKLCFEITETAAITNLADASEFIRVLKQQGCTFSLDDFGSGLSSYAYIQKLPVDYIKIDGIFIRNMVENVNDQALVRSINELAHFMGMQTVAEFVENREILNVLQQIGVDHSQGYGIKKPMLLESLV